MTIRHSEARDRGVSELDSPRFEGGLAGNTADVDDGGPSGVDKEGKSRLFRRPGILLNEQRPGHAHLGLWVQSGGKLPDDELNLDRKAGEERKGCHGG